MKMKKNLNKNIKDKLNFSIKNSKYKKLRKKEIILTPKEWLLKLITIISLLIFGLLSNKNSITKI
jgi:hypothetical protein